MITRNLPVPRRIAAKSLSLALASGVCLFFCTAAAAQTCTPQNTCTDPRGCPDFVVDQGVLANMAAETRTYAVTDCSVLEGEVPAGTNRFIVFSTMISNFGPGAITLGNPQDHPEWFDLVTCHGHAHIKEYADYRLWPRAAYTQWQAIRAANPGACADDLLAANPALASQMIEGGKRGFCLFDVIAHATLSAVPCPATADPQTYFDCNFSGLSVCWADIYEPIPGFTYGQSIAITNVPNGDYVLENEANARHFFTEADYSNNSASVIFRLRNGRVRVLKR